MTCAMLCGPSSPATTPSGWSRRTDTAAQPRCAPPGRRRPSSAPHNAAYFPNSRGRYMPSIGGQFRRLEETAVREKQSHVDYLEALLTAEMEERESRAVARL